MISIRVRRLVESESQLRSYSTTTATRYNMASSVSDITQKLKSLSIDPTAIAHAKTSSTATWKEALIASGSAPKSFETIKTLVYKPKTAKTATPVPVVVIARDETDTNSAAIGKKLNLKELRLASEDLLTDFFSLDKNSCTFHSTFLFSSFFLIYIFIVSPLSLSESTFSKVVTVLDASIVSSSSTFAIHANSSSETCFLTGKAIESYLKSLETAEVKVQEIDLQSLATAPAAVAQTSKAPVKEKDAKIEGAVQIAIGVKKEVDFAAWYTNVNCRLLDLFIKALSELLLSRS